MRCSVSVTSRRLFIIWDYDLVTDNNDYLTVFMWIGNANSDTCPLTKSSLVAGRLGPNQGWEHQEQIPVSNDHHCWKIKRLLLFGSRLKSSFICYQVDKHLINDNRCLSLSLFKSTMMNTKLWRETNYYCLSYPKLHVFGTPPIIRYMLFELRLVQLHFMSRPQTKLQTIATIRQEIRKCRSAFLPFWVGCLFWHCWADQLSCLKSCSFHQNGFAQRICSSSLLLRRLMAEFLQSLSKR